MSNTTFALVIFGIMFIMSLFVYIPFSDTVNLTDEGTFLEGQFNVDTEWETRGTLTGEMQTDGQLIYPSADQEGTWTSNLIEGEQFNLIRLNALTDTRDGTIEYTVNLWDETAEGPPDESFTGEIDEIEFQEEINEVEQYNVFEIVIDMEETAGNSNKRPHVDSLNVEYVENLDRQGLGFNESMFQLFTLFVLIGSGLLALTRSF